MDFQFEQEWRQTLEKAGTMYGEALDLTALLFLIGVQELGQGYRTFKKDEKVALMHVAICTLLEPYGYYKLEGRDQDDWPHWTKSDALPELAPPQQERLIKEAAIEYFKKY